MKKNTQRGGARGVARGAASGGSGSSSSGRSRSGPGGSSRDGARGTKGARGTGATSYGSPRAKSYESTSKRTSGAARSSSGGYSRGSTAADSDFGRNRYESSSARYARSNGQSDRENRPRSDRPHSRESMGWSDQPHQTKRRSLKEKEFERDANSENERDFELINEELRDADDAHSARAQHAHEEDVADATGYSIDPKSLYIYGRRSVAEALRSGREIEKIFVEYGVNEAGIKDIVFSARRKKIPMVVADKKKFRQLELESGAANYAQGIIALSVAYESVEDHELFQQARDQHVYPLIVALDGINDPHNLGAIARSIACSGAQGLLLPERNSAPVSAAAIKTAAGAFEYLLVAKTTNLGVSLERAKEAGFWIIGTDAESTHSYTADLYDRPVVLVIGSEGSGMRTSTRKMCDALISIPLHSEISSLNASVAAGVILFEVARQRAVAESTKN